MPQLPGFTYGNNLPNFSPNEGRSHIMMDILSKQLGGQAGISSLEASAPTMGEINTQANEYLTTLGQQIADQGAANAANAEAQGFAATAAAYGTAATIAGTNAQMAGIAGGLENYQVALEAKRTMAAGTAAAASSGFTGGGSGLNILGSSKRQEALATQMATVQTGMNEGGYLQQKAAAQAEQTAAIGAEGAAQAQAAAAETAGAFAGSVAGWEGQNLQGMVGMAGLANLFKNQTYAGGYNGGNPMTGAGLAYQGFTQGLSGAGQMAAGQLGTFGNIINMAQGLVH